MILIYFQFKENHRILTSIMYVKKKLSYINMYTCDDRSLDKSAPNIS